MNQYDFIIIGGGAGGIEAAVRAGSRGRTVALITDGELGGVWLNQGCIAVKSLVASQKMYRHALAGRKYGVRMKDVEATMAEWLERQLDVIFEIREDVEQRLKEARVTIIPGRAMLDGAHRVLVEQTEGRKIELQAQAIVIASGSVPTPLPCYEKAPDGRVVGTSDHFVKLTCAPRNMLIVGGGYIGCEMGQIFHTIGTEVTIVESGPHLLPEMEPDAGTILQDKLKAEGMKIHLNATVEGLEVPDESDEAIVRISSGEELRADKVLVAVGRKANVKNLGLEKAGVTVDKGITVNDFCQTNIPHIYAIGDCTGRVALAHSAVAQARIAVDHALGSNRCMDWDNVPFCVYTVPEIAATGYTEEQAREKGMDPVVARCPLRHVGRPMSGGEPEGFVRLIADRKTTRITGGMIVGAHASEMISILTTALKMQATVADLQSTVLPHPSLGEAIIQAAKELPAEP
ncbi:dihydrolipoyl dehydrogenase [Verrucomicrobia bacterium LW23]|nr:dihydrolipoyl dehydrogenase [Verrucomicrobia bacterium LW23]